MSRWLTIDCPGGGRPPQGPAFKSYKDRYSTYIYKGRCPHCSQHFAVGKTGNLRRHAKEVIVRSEPNHEDVYHAIVTLLRQTQTFIDQQEDAGIPVNYRVKWDALRESILHMPTKLRSEYDKYIEESILSAQAQGGGGDSP